MDYHEFKNLAECKAAVVDVDKTLVAGRTAQGMGVRLLERELYSGHLKNFLHGLRNFPVVFRMGKTGGESAAMEYFFTVLGETGCADKKSAYRFAEQYIADHELPGASEFVDYLHDKGLYVVCSSLGSSIAIDAAQTFFGFDACSDGNEATYEDGIITGCRITTSDRPIGRQRSKKQAVEKVLAEHDLTLADCVVVGDNGTDREMMENARYSIASPLADIETIKAADIWVSDYVTLLKSLPDHRKYWVL